MALKFLVLHLQTAQLTKVKLALDTPQHLSIVNQMEIMEVMHHMEILTVAGMTQVF